MYRSPNATQMYRHALMCTLWEMVRVLIFFMLPGDAAYALGRHQDDAIPPLRYLPLSYYRLDVPL